MNLENIEAAAGQAATGLQEQVERLMLGNSLVDWGYALAVLAGSLAVVALLKWLLVSRLSKVAQRTTIIFDDAVVAALRASQLWMLFFPALAFASGWLDLPKVVVLVLKGAGTIGMFLQVGLWFSTLTAELIDHSRRRAAANNSGAASSLSAVGFVARLVIWAFVLLLALDNLGVNITALVAGLGVGGIAVALAVQNVLGDLFASLSIVIDKPFELGDFIVIDSYMGNVEHVGLKTTRLRSLSGEQIVFSNADLLGARVRNFKRMAERRVLFTLGVPYQTTPAQLRQVPEILRDEFQRLPNARLERAHFFRFGDSSLDFEVVYWMKTPEYDAYMDTQQALNLALLERFSDAGIEFAYPTRTLVLDAPIPVTLHPQPASQDALPLGAAGKNV